MERQKSKYKALFNLLSVISLFLAAFIILGSSTSKYQLEAMYNTIKHMWMFSLFLPLPISAIIHGALKYKTQRVKSNIILGVIFSVLLIVYSMFTPIFAHMYNTNAEYLSYIEQETQIDLPKESTIIQQDWQELTSVDGNILKFDSFVRINSKEKINLENFKSTLSNQEKDFLPVMFSASLSQYDYFLIYNTDNNIFWELDYSNGKNYFAIAYNSEDNVLSIIEFSKE